MLLFLGLPSQHRLSILRPWRIGSYCVLVVIIFDDPTAPTAFSIVTLVVIIEIVPTVDDK